MSTALKKLHGNSSYTLEIAQEICETIATTSIGLKRLCDARDHWPSEYTIFKWLEKHEEFAKGYARARELQADMLRDEILEIADEKNGDLYVEKGSDGVWRAKIDGEAIQRSKLQVDARKWVAAHLNPKKYGPKLDVTSDNQPLAAGTTNVHVTETRIQALIGVALKRKGDDPLGIEDLMS